MNKKTLSSSPSIDKLSLSSYLSPSFLSREGMEISTDSRCLDRRDLISLCYHAQSYAFPVKGAS